MSLKTVTLKRKESGDFLTQKNRQTRGGRKNISFFLINNIVSAILEDCNILKFLIFGQQNHSILRLF